MYRDFTVSSQVVWAMWTQAVLHYIKIQNFNNLIYNRNLRIRFHLLLTPEEGVTTCKSDLDSCVVWYVYQNLHYNILPYLRWQTVLKLFHIIIKESNWNFNLKIFLNLQKPNISIALIKHGENFPNWKNKQTFPKIKKKRI